MSSERSRSRSRDFSKGNQKSKSKSRKAKRRERSPQRFSSLIEEQYYDPVNGNSIENLIAAKIIRLPQLPKELPKPPKPKVPPNEEVIRYLNRNKMIRKDPNQPVFFNSKKFMPENLIQFCQSRLCSDYLSKNLIKKNIIRMASVFGFRLNFNFDKLIQKIRAMPTQQFQRQTVHTPWHLVPKSQLTDIQAIQLISQNLSQNQLLKNGVKRSYFKAGPQGQSHEKKFPILKQLSNE